MDLGFHLALSYRDLKHPTSRQNFANVVGQNHALILTQCLIALTKSYFADRQVLAPNVKQCKTSRIEMDKNMDNQKFISSVTLILPSSQIPPFFGV